MRSRVLYYFISTRDFQIGAPAVAGIGAPSVPSRRTRLSLMPVPFGYMNYETTEIDSEASEVCTLCNITLGALRLSGQNKLSTCSGGPGDLRM